MALPGPNRDRLECVELNQLARHMAYVVLVAFVYRLKQVQQSFNLQEAVLVCLHRMHRFAFRKRNVAGRGFRSEKGAKGALAPRHLLQQGGRGRSSPGSAACTGPVLLESKTCLLSSARSFPGE